MIAPSLRQLATYAKTQLDNGVSMGDVAEELAAELAYSKRTHLIDNLLLHVRAQYELNGSTAYVTVASAESVDKSLMERLKDDLEKLLSVKKVELAYETDPSLLTGLTFESAVKHIDRSGKKLLRQLQYHKGSRK